MHDVRIALNTEFVGDLDTAGPGDTPDIVTAQIDQHEMFSQFLRVSQQGFFIRLIFRLVHTPWAGSGQRSHGNF